MSDHKIVGRKLLGFVVDIRRNADNANDLIEGLERLARKLGDDLGYEDQLSQMAWDLYNDALFAFGRTRA